MSGKGDKPRPFTDRKTFESNFDAIFRKGKDAPDNSLTTTRQLPDKNLITFPDKEDKDEAES